MFIRADRFCDKYSCRIAKKRTFIIMTRERALVVKMKSSIITKNYPQKFDYCGKRVNTNYIYQVQFFQKFVAKKTLIASQHEEKLMQILRCGNVISQTQN